MKTTMTSFLLLLLLAGGVAPGRAQGKTFQWGVCGHPFNQEAYWHVPVETQLDLVAELGATWYRIDWPQAGLAANTARYDALLAEAQKRNLRLLPILFSSPGARSKDATPEQIRAAAFEYARMIAGRYRGRITHWELSNELDAYAMVRKGDKLRDGTTWIWGDPDGSKPEHYEEGRYQKVRAELQGLAEGVRAGDPNAKTIVDTAGWLHYGLIERLVREDKVPFDILAWHWYSEMGDMTKVQGKLDLLTLLKGYGKPLWITEIDRRGGSIGGKEQEQADYLGQVAAQLSAHPAVDALIAYELLDQPYFGATNPESHYGLVEVTRDEQGKWRVGRKKKAFDALRAAITAAGKAKGESGK